MPLPDVSQPQASQINSWLRLRRYDGHWEQLLPGYQDPVVYQNSEGIFDERDIPNSDYVRNMCGFLNSTGELYYIEVKEGEEYRPVGDVTVKGENPPIAIWMERYRGKGIGTLVMRAVIQRLKQLGFQKITGSTVYKWNAASQRLHEKLGFTLVSESERERIYQLDLKE